jgi:nuclear GTP-binding protein
MPKHMADCYGVNMWTDAEDFIGQVAIKTGKLWKGGEPDMLNTSKTILNDWQRGKIPYFEKPPKVECNAVQHTVQQIMELAPIETDRVPDDEKDEVAEK